MGPACLAAAGVAGFAAAAPEVSIPEPELVAINRDGDLLFSVSKDQQICVWFSHNGERLGTYKGHQGNEADHNGRDNVC